MKRKRIPSPFSPNAPTTERRYSSATIIASSKFARPRTDEENAALMRKQERQLEEVLDRMVGARTDMTPLVMITLGDGGPFVEVRVGKGLTEQQLWDIENATLTTLVGPNGDAELRTTTFRYNQAF